MLRVFYMLYVIILFYIRARPLIRVEQLINCCINNAPLLFVLIITSTPVRDEKEKRIETEFRLRLIAE